MLTLMLYACGLLAPSIDDIRADRDLRAQKFAIPPGECWVLDGLPPLTDIEGCQPGPVVPGFDENFDLVVQALETRWQMTPDEELLVGVALHRSASVYGWAVGGRLQLEALQRGASPELAARLAPLRPGEDLLIDVHLHATADVVIANDTRENRLGFATMRRMMDTDPRPPVDSLDDLALEVDGTAAGIMWASSEELLKWSRRADAAFETVLAGGDVTLLPLMP